MRKILGAIAIGILLSGCMVKTDVEAYSKLPPEAANFKVYIAPFVGQDASSLQWQTNAKILAAVLQSKGSTIVTSRTKADIIAFTGFGIDHGKIVRTSYNIPHFGVTGYDGSSTTGSVFGNTFYATTTYSPTYGVTGYTSGVRSDVVYTRSFALDIIERQSGKKLFEARSLSRGSCSSFTNVANQIISATLSNYPEGKIGTVELSSNGDC